MEYGKRVKLEDTERGPGTPSTFRGKEAAGIAVLLRTELEVLIFGSIKGRKRSFHEQ